MPSSNLVQQGCQLPIEFVGQGAKVARASQHLGLQGARASWQENLVCQCLLIDGDAGLPRTMDRAAGPQ